ncbi:MAG: alpha/beta hydrolase, partial [Staphylococcus sp.]|nr:alpha/beta hydrolase [Staphylococcus sp.]
TSGALTRYNKSTFGEPDKNISADTYVKNELEDGVCSDEEIIQKYRDDDLVAKEISIGLIFTLMDGIAYLKEHPSHFIDPVLILHGKEDGLVSYKDSIDLYNEIASKKKSLYIYENLQHEIFNESSYNQSIFRDIIDWLDSKNR